VSSVNGSFGRATCQAQARPLARAEEQGSPPVTFLGTGNRTYRLESKLSGTPAVQRRSAGKGVCSGSRRPAASIQDAGAIVLQCHHPTVAAQTAVLGPPGLKVRWYRRGYCIVYYSHHLRDGEGWPPRPHSRPEVSEALPCVS